MDFDIYDKEPPSIPCVEVHRLGLSVYPKSAEFDISGSASKLMLTNNGKCRLAIKIKCSDNRLYSVAPVYTTIDPEATEVARDINGPAKNDKLVILYTEFKSSSLTSPTDIKCAFVEGKPTSETIVPLTVREGPIVDHKKRTSVVGDKRAPILSLGKKRHSGSDSSGNRGSIGY